MRRTLLLGTIAMVAIAIGSRAEAQSPGRVAPKHGIQLAGGEHIVNSRVVSDTVVSSSDSSGGAVTTSDEGAVVSGGGGSTVGPGVIGRPQGQSDLFYNFYTQGDANQINAQMYVAPQPVPPWVGHTWYTYQPLMPHEYLYTHHNRYHQHYDYGRGLNRTKVSYKPAAHQVLRDMYFNFRIPR